MTVSGAVCGLAHIAAFAGYQTSDFRTEFNTQNSFIKDCSKEHARVRRASSAKELRKSYMVKIKSNRRRDADPTWFRDTLARRLVKKEFRSEGETAHYLRVFTVLMRCWTRNICRREGALPQKPESLSLIHTGASARWSKNVRIIGTVSTVSPCRLQGKSFVLNRPRALKRKVNR